MGYQTEGFEVDSAAESMIANELRILSDSDLQRALQLSSYEVEYIAYAVRIHALSVASQIINNEEVNKSYELAQEQVEQSKFKTPDSNTKHNTYRLSKKPNE